MLIKDKKNKPLNSQAQDETRKLAEWLSQTSTSNLGLYKIQWANETGINEKLFEQISKDPLSSDPRFRDHFPNPKQLQDHCAKDLLNKGLCQICYDQTDAGIKLCHKCDETDQSEIICGSCAGSLTLIPLSCEKGHPISSVAVLWIQRHQRQVRWTSSQDLIDFQHRVLTCVKFIETFGSKAFQELRLFREEQNAQTQTWTIRNQVYSNGFVFPKGSPSIQKALEEAKNKNQGQEEPSLHPVISEDLIMEIHGTVLDEETIAKKCTVCLKGFQLWGSCLSCRVEYCLVCDLLKSKCTDSQHQDDYVKANNEVVRKCPKCQIQTLKISGCPDVFCSNCQLSWIYNAPRKRNVIRAHNPDLVEFQNQKKQNGYKIWNSNKNLSLNQSLVDWINDDQGLWLDFFDPTRENVKQEKPLNNLDHLNHLNLDHLNLDSHSGQVDQSFKSLTRIANNRTGGFARKPDLQRVTRQTDIFFPSDSRYPQRGITKIIIGPLVKLESFLKQSLKKIELTIGQFYPTDPFDLPIVPVCLRQRIIEFKEVLQVYRILLHTQLMLKLNFNNSLLEDLYSCQQNFMKREAEPKIILYKIKEHIREKEFLNLDKRMQQAVKLALMSTPGIYTPSPSVQRLMKQFLF